MIYALPHSLPPHLMDFHESYDQDGKHEHWSKIWNFVPNGSDYTHFIQAPPGSKISEDPLCEIGCPYAVRGFDFDYVGLLWLGDLLWRSGRWVIDTKHVFERGIKRQIAKAKAENDSTGPAHAALLRSVQEAYRIILTRPMKGLVVWIVISRCSRDILLDLPQPRHLTYPRAVRLTLNDPQKIHLRPLKKLAAQLYVAPPA